MREVFADPGYMYVTPVDQGQGAYDLNAAGQANVALLALHEAIHKGKC